MSVHAPVVNRRSYPTDLTDAQWDLVKPMLPSDKAGGLKGGAPPKVSRREIVNAILYITRAGCSWRNLPHDLPSWKTVYHYFRLWKNAGVIDEIHDALVAKVRESVGKATQPTVGIVDSQSVKTTEKGGPCEDTMAARR